MSGLCRRGGGLVHLLECDQIDPMELYSLARRNSDRLERYFPGTQGAGATLATANAFLDHHGASQRAGRSILFGVRGPRGHLAGLIFINAIDPDTAMAEASCIIDVAHEGSGLMRAAMTDALSWCRAELDLHRVRLLIAPDNARALTLARALGFVREPRAGRPFRKGTAWETVLNYYALILS